MRGPFLGAFVRPARLGWVVFWLLGTLATTAATARQVGPETQAQRLLVRGMTRAYLDDHEQALQFYEQALRLTPGEPTLLSAMAESYAALDDLQTALFYAEQARSLAPETRYYHQHLIQLFIQAGETTRAAEACHSLLATFPDHLPTLRLLATLEAGAGHLEAALSALETVAARTAPTQALLAEMLQLYLRLGDDDGTEATLKSLLDVSDHPETHRKMLGDLYVRQGRTGEAAALYENALRERPGDVEAAMALAGLYRRLGRDAAADTLLAHTLAVPSATPAQLMARATAFRDRAGDDPHATTLARTLVRQVLRRQPGHPDALLLLGTLLFDEGAFAAAADTLALALEQNPRDPMTWDRTAEAYLKAFRPARAADVAEEGLMLFPGRPALLRAAAFGRLRAGDRGAAREHFEEALALREEEAPADSTERADLLSGLALTFPADAVRADSLFSRALALAPASAPVLNRYAAALADRGRDLPRALELAERARRQDPGNPAFLTTLGWVHFQMNHLEEALQWLERAVDAGGDARTYERAGDVLARMGRFDEARRRWRHALELTPDNRSLQTKLEQQPH